MASALIVYGSTTGNTEFTAQTIGQVFSNAGMDVEVQDVSSVAPAGLCAKYDLVLFGCSTWGDDEIELQDDFLPFFEEMDSIGANGKNVAVFGCGDSSYTYFCGAVDAISEKLQQLGANVLDTFKVDGSPQSEKDAIDEWAESVLKMAH